MELSGQTSAARPAFVVNEFFLLTVPGLNFDLRIIYTRDREILNPYAHNRPSLNIRGMSLKRSRIMPA